MESEAKTRLWTKNYILVILLNLLIMSIYQIMNNAIPLYVNDIGQGSLTAAGVIGGAFTLSALVLRPIMGRLADRHGKKALVLVGMSLFGICCGLCAATTNSVLLVILRVLQGIFFSAVSTGASAASSDIIPSERVMEGVGYYGLGSTVATAVGPGISLFMIERVGYRGDFLLVLGVAVIGALLGMLISYPTYGSARQAKQKINTGEELSRDRWYDRLVERTAIPMSLVMLFAALAQSSISTFLVIFARGQGIQDVGLYFTIYAVALLITRPTTGRLSDRFGTNKIILPGIALIILAFLLLANSSSLWHILTIAVIYGLGYGSVQPVLNALMVKYCPPSRRGLGNATFHIAMDGGYGLGAILWGIVADGISLPGVFYGAALCVAAAAILYFVLLFKCEKRRSNAK